MFSEALKKLSFCIAAGLSLAMIFSSCKKHKPGNGNGTGTSNSCPLIREYNSQPDGIAQTWNLVPDKDNHLREVDGLNDYGTTSITETVGASGLNLQYNGIITAYVFNANIFTANPSEYSYTTSNGLKATNVVHYDDAGEISQIDQLDASGQPSSQVNLRYKDGNLMQAIYQEETGTRELTTYQAVGYDDHPNPYADMAGSRYLFYNWEYFSVADIQMGRTYQHCSKNNCLGYYVELNGIKYIDQTFTYVYDSRGYPTSADQHYIFRSSESGVVIHDEHYTINYTYNNCDE